MLAWEPEFCACAILLPKATGAGTPIFGGLAFELANMDARVVTNKHIHQPMLVGIIGARRLYEYGLCPTALMHNAGCINNWAQQ